MWGLTIGGEVVEFERRAQLVRRQVYPGVRTSDLTDDYPDLTATVGASTSELIEDLDEAWTRMRRDLDDASIQIHRLKGPDQLVDPLKMLAAAIR